MNEKERKKVKFSLTKFTKKGSLRFVGFGEIDDENLYTKSKIYGDEEARKLAEQGANYACIEDKTVFGWAIHYFEEEKIEGKLYNEDGTEYKPEIKVTTAPKPITKPKQ